MITGDKQTFAIEWELDEIVNTWEYGWIWLWFHGQRFGVTRGNLRPDDAWSFSDTPLQDCFYEWGEFLENMEKWTVPAENLTEWNLAQTPIEKFLFWYGECCGPNSDSQPVEMCESFEKLDFRFLCSLPFGDHYRMFFIGKDAAQLRVILIEQLDNEPQRVFDGVLPKAQMRSVIQQWLADYEAFREKARPLLENNDNVDVFSPGEYEYDTEIFAEYEKRKDDWEFQPRDEKWVEDGRQLIKILDGIIRCHENEEGSFSFTHAVDEKMDCLARLEYMLSLLKLAASPCDFPKTREFAFRIDEKKHSRLAQTFRAFSLYEWLEDACDAEASEAEKERRIQVIETELARYSEDEILPAAASLATLVLRATSRENPLYEVRFERYKRRLLESPTSAVREIFLKYERLEQLLNDERT